MFSICAFIYAMCFIQWANHILILIRNIQVVFSQFCFFQYQKHLTLAALHKYNSALNTFENSRSDCSFAFSSSVPAADIQKNRFTLKMTFVCSWCFDKDRLKSKIFENTKSGREKCV